MSCKNWIRANRTLIQSLHQPCSRLNSLVVRWPFWEALPKHATFLNVVKIPVEDLWGGLAKCYKVIWMNYDQVQNILWCFRSIPALFVRWRHVYYFQSTPMPDVWAGSSGCEPVCGGVLRLGSVRSNFWPWGKNFGRCGLDARLSIAQDWSVLAPQDE